PPGARSVSHPMRRITERPPAATPKITPQQLSGGLQTESASRRPFHATTGDSKVNGVGETSHDRENATTGVPPLGGTGRTGNPHMMSIQGEPSSSAARPFPDSQSPCELPTILVYVASCDDHRAISSTTDIGAPPLPDETEVAQEMQASLE
ncbi:hypothetical protein FOZ63_015670, partial [Perkinsus olseni]